MTMTYFSTVSTQSGGPTGEETLRGAYRLEIFWQLDGRRPVVVVRRGEFRVNQRYLILPYFD